MTHERDISERLISTCDAIAPAKMPTVLVAFAIAAISLLASDALAGQRPAIPLSPDFDYSQICVANTGPAQPRDWAQWDGKSAGNVSLDAMLQDAQTLYSPFSRYARSPATAARLSLYLSQQAFPGSGRAFYLYGRILAESNTASSHFDQIFQSETEALKRGVPEAGTFLGKLYRRGELVPADLKVAQSYLVAAANAGDRAADLELARLYMREPQLTDRSDDGPLQLGRVLARMSENLGKGDCSVLNGFAEILVDPDLGLDDPEGSARWLRAAVRVGDLRAISTLAKRYMEGDKGVAVDRQSAAELLRQAAAMGHSASRLSLADLILSDSVDGKGRAEAFKLLAQEEERGNPAAYQMQAAFYRGSYGTPADPALERRNLEKAAALDDVDLRVLDRLGSVYANGSGGPVNLELAKQTLVRSAGLGSARAAFELYSLASGQAPAMVLDRMPLDYLKEASDGGLASAMRERSSLYACGAGVDKDAVKARTWLEKAAAAGDSESLMMLADAAFKEQHADSDAVGFGFLQKAAARGDVEAMMRVSLAYRDGRGTAQDVAASEEWRRQAVAADGGIAVLAEARTLLVPENGQERDALKARSMLEKAASSGSADLLFELGKLYADTDPALDMDRPRANALFIEAAEKGSVSAMLRLVDFKVTAGEGGGRDWHQWLARARSTGDLRATLKEAETETEDDRKVAILAPVVARPMCLGKDRLQVALAVRDIRNFHDDYIRLFDQLIADDGDEPGIQYQIARFLLSERPEEKARAIDIMASAASGGKREAMRELGRIYSTGKLVPVDQAEASKWLFKAARLGDAGALESLIDLILAQQISLDRPMAGDQEVEKLLQDLAAQNSPQVAMLMSKLYLRLADGSPAFRELGKIWTLKAAELGNGQAMLNASDFYATGTHGFDQSNTESTKWLSKAARAGFRGAFEKYAIALQIGFGTQPDVEEAQQWLSRSTTLAN